MAEGRGRRDGEGVRERVAPIPLDSCRFDPGNKGGRVRKIFPLFFSWTKQVRLGDPLTTLEEVTEGVAGAATNTPLSNQIIQLPAALHVRFTCARSTPSDGDRKWDVDNAGSLNG